MIDLHVARLNLHGKLTKRRSTVSITLLTVNNVSLQLVLSRRQGEYYRLLQYNEETNKWNLVQRFNELEDFLSFQEAMHCNNDAISQQAKQVSK